ncbi:predicted protein [Brucella ceti B1/94]|nr:predicted protein [Brucella ceti B1/94]EEY25549.1 predicted protein [Brucella sp. F5/99]EEZ07969.1 predicted protein [Brucella ceti M490/95/1]
MASFYAFFERWPICITVMHYWSLLANRASDRYTHIEFASSQNSIRNTALLLPSRIQDQAAHPPPARPFSFSSTDFDFSRSALAISASGGLGPCVTHKPQQPDTLLIVDKSGVGRDCSVKDILTANFPV